ncbi:MAG TPA: hypothetical protein VHB79_38785 [Polyangiaceae bacterium]|nr:hypothetical protein [Polyangiaceae bacterium]
MTDTKPQRKPLPPVAPLIVGPGNALPATGFPWRWCRDFWESRGRAFVGAGKKRGIPAQALLAELERTGAAPDLSSIVNSDIKPEDAAEAVRRAIGVSRR